MASFVLLAMLTALRRDDRLKELAQVLRGLKMVKGSIGWPLEELEEATEDVEERDSDSDDE